MTLTRRTALSLVCMSLLPTRLHANKCEPVLSALSLCDATGWRLASVTGETASFTSETGITATLTLRTGLSEEELSSEGWMVSHAPISARAKVIAVSFADVDGHLASTVAYLPPHMSPPGVIALSSFQDNGTSFVLSTRGPGETYSDLHRQAHEGLLAAIRLDLPE